MPKIMALPMSHRDIQPILEQLGGPGRARGWQGGLPIDYRLGGEAARLHVQHRHATDVQPNYVVEGRIRGSERPDEWVVLGNHHDAWVFGGVDPSSGTASMMELTKALGRAGNSKACGPRRTLVFCSWDGEEVTLTGLHRVGRAVPRRAAGRRRSPTSTSTRPPRAPASTVERVGSLAPMIVELTQDADATRRAVALRRVAHDRTSDGQRPGRRRAARRGAGRRPASAAAPTTRCSSTTSAAAGRRDGLRRRRTASTTRPTTATTGCDRFGDPGLPVPRA